MKRFAIAAIPVIGLACAAALGLNACAHRSAGNTDVEDTVYERGSSDLAQAPEAAAACVARNAASEGLFAAQTPLYGTTAMGVSVRTSATGHTLATLNVIPNGRGSRAATIMLREGPRLDRAKLETILKGC